MIALLTVFAFALANSVAFVTDCMYHLKGLTPKSNATTPVIRVLLVASWTFFLYLLLNR